MTSHQVPLFCVWVHPITFKRLSEPEYYKMVNRADYVIRNGYGEGEYIFEEIEDIGECVLHLLYDFEAIETFAD